MQSSPTLILLRGPAGVGKSTIGAQLQIRLGEGWAYIDIDRLKHAISKKSSELRSRISHNTANYFIQQLFQHHYNVIAEEIFLPEYYQEVLRLRHENNAQIFQFFLTAPLEVLLQRDQERVVKTKGEENITKLYNLIQPVAGEIIIDTTRYSPEEIVGQIVQVITAQ